LFFKEEIGTKVLENFTWRVSDSEELVGFSHRS